MRFVVPKCVGSFLAALRISNLPYLLILFVLLVGLPFRASAQNATIVGTVTDTSGPVIANVKITVTHVETGLAHTFNKNEAGQDEADDLPVGHDNLKAEAAG